MGLSKRSMRWSGFRSLLCPVDFSEQSRRALRYAEAVARRANAALAVVYANDPLLVAAAAAALHDRGVAARSATELRTFVHDTLSTSAGQRLRVSTHVSIGDPCEQILALARRCRSDLIVMGTHGLTGAGRFVLGSTTRGVLERTTIPVLAVPRLLPRRADKHLAQWPGKRILAAVELGRGSERQVAVSTATADWFGSSLLICSRDAGEIAALAAAERVGLVMIALRDKQGWLDSRRGSISYHLLTHAVTPVLAYPPRWQPESRNRVRP